MLDHDFAQLCFGRRIQFLDILTSKFLTVMVHRDGASSTLTCVQADTASAACPAHPGSPDITSMTFAAVI